MKFAADTGRPSQCCAFDPRLDVAVAAVTDLAAIGHGHGLFFAVHEEDGSTMRATCLDAEEVVVALAELLELAVDACSHLPLPSRPMAKSISTPALSVLIASAFCSSVGLMPAASQQSRRMS